MSEKVLLSAIIPFQEFHVLKNGLLSSLAKGNTNCELIFVHDSAKEISGEDLRELKESCLSKIVYLSGDFGSPGAARNAGLSIASGDWIAFWDSDDKVNFPMIQEAIISSLETEVIIGGFQTLEIENNSRSREFYRCSRTNLVAFPGLWRHIFKRETVRDLKFNSLKIGEDICFLFDADIPHRKRKNFNTNFYTYSISNNQTTKKLILSLHKKYFIEELTRRLTEVKRLDYWKVGVYWRQLISFLVNSKLLELPFAFRQIFSVLRGKSLRNKILFFVYISFAFSMRRL